jgi:2-oxoglutarate dehydrogenase E1 component
MLLPHGYEGQGPEHSSARMERYLQLAAQRNWRVADCSTAAQYFHLLRQQAYNLTSDPRPLVVMSPKSLLRHAFASATLQELVEGTFHKVIDDAAALKRADRIQGLLVCTGKVAVDLLSQSKRAQAEDVAIVRLEMLYPFPGEELQKVFANYPNVREVVWVQEEPRNMGAWNYISARLSALVRQNIEVRVIARPERASPASGFMDLFMAEQEQLLAKALSSSIKEHGESHVR